MSNHRHIDELENCSRFYKQRQ